MYASLENNTAFTKAFFCFPVVYIERDHTKKAECIWEIQ